MTKLSNADRFMLFACDQKIEHLNAIDPRHFFNIASQGRLSAMATQLGLIAKYGSEFPKVPYIAKLNSKTNIVPTEQKDPLSRQLWSVDQVLDLKQRERLSIVGVGATCIWALNTKISCSSKPHRWCTKRGSMI